MVEKDLSIKRKFRAKKAVFSFLLSFAILYWLLSQVDIHRTIEIIKTINIIYYLLAFGTVYISILLRVVRWRIILENANYPTDWPELGEIYFLSWFVNSIVPAKLGDVYRGYLLKKSRDYPTSGVLGTIFVERIVDIFFMVFLFFSMGLSIFGKNLPEDVRLSIFIGIIICLALGLGLWMLKTQARLFTFFPGKIESFFQSFKEGTSTSLTKGSFPGILMLTAGIWLLEGARLLFVIKALSIETSLDVILFIAIGASFLTSLPVTPAGLGAVEVTMAGLLTLFGVDKDIAVSVTLLDRLLSYWSIVVFGGAFYILSKRT